MMTPVLSLSHALSHALMRARTRARVRRPDRRRPLLAHPAAAALLVAACTTAWADARLERGRYLVETIAGCGNCHTPQGPNGPVAGKTLAGGMPFEEPVFTAIASNITPDRETGIGTWTDAQIALAIREGRRPDGSLIGPPMPFGLYRELSDNDVAAIVAYLRTVPAVKNAVPKSQYRMRLPPAYGPPVGRVPDVPTTDKVAYGRYLAGPVGHCMECHSKPGPHGAPDLQGGLGAGGMVFNGPWGKSVATNLTPTGIGHYTDAQLKTVITTGVRPDGSRLLPPMGVSYYAGMTGSDLDAVIAYLRSLPAR